MTQSRIQDYGSPIVAQSLKTAIGSIVKSAILSGNQFFVSANNTVGIKPGVAVTNQGVIITETEIKTLIVTNTSNPVDYTIYYSHVDQNVSGGATANLIIQPGLLTNSTVAGVILGYVRYPGGAVPLSPAYFYQPATLYLGAVEPTRYNAPWTIPINGMGYMVTTASGGTITNTSVFNTATTPPHMYLSLINNSVANGNLTLTFPFKVMGSPYGLFQLLAAIDVSTTLNPILIDSAGTSFVLAVSPLTGQPSFVYNEFLIPAQAIQHPNSLLYVQLQMSLSIGRSISIQALGLNQYNLPV